MGMQTSDLPNIKDIEDPKELLTKIKSGKSVTVKRSCLTVAKGSKEQQAESKRKTIVKRKTKIVEGMSSEKNVNGGFY